MGQSNPSTAQTETSADETWPYPLRSIVSLYRSGQHMLLDTYRGLYAFLSSFLFDSLGINDLYDDAGWKLLLAMGLPLVDGVFPAIVLSGSLSTVPGLLVSGGTIFGGPWMLTIIFNEMSGDSVGMRLRRVVKVAGIVIPVAGLEAVAAPTIASLLQMSVFQVFSGLVILTVGACIANDILAEFLVPPKWILALGLVSSLTWNALTSATITPTFVVDPVLVMQAVGAATIASAIAGVAAILGPSLDKWIDTDAFEVGAGIALALVPLSIAGLIPSLASLAVFALALIFSISHGDDQEAEARAAN